MHAYNIQPTNYETITPCKHSMKWTLSFQVQIPTSKEATLVMMSMVQARWWCNGQIGMAAVYTGIEWSRGH